MGNLSTHFSRKEFKCKCSKCQFDTVDVALIDLLESVRAHFGRPVKINSGCRCASYNVEIGGTMYSQHLKGRAADFIVKGHSPSDVQDWIEAEYPDLYGMGKYDSFTHIDTRNHRARWDG